MGGVRTLIGCPLGKDEGAVLGEIVGSRLCEEVGTTLGETLGEIVGSRLCEEVGTALGETLGEIVGSRLCEEVGTTLGETLGALLGEEEGAVVGEDGERAEKMSSTMLMPCLRSGCRPMCSVVFPC